MKYLCTRSLAVAVLLALVSTVTAADDLNNELEVGKVLGRDRVRLVDRETYPELPPPRAGAQYAVIDGVLIELDAENYELLQVLKDIASVEIPPTDVGGVETLKDKKDKDKDKKGEKHRDKVEGRALNIPEGHYPPPGSCRVWYPDRPAGHQPPPTSCAVQVPAGAVLIGE